MDNKMAMKIDEDYANSFQNYLNHDADLALDGYFDFDEGMPADKFLDLLDALEKQND